MLGIRTSPVVEELIVSREDGRIDVYNVSSRCCVRSWQLTSSQSLSCPAVQHPSTRLYWAAVNQTELMSWRFSDNSISQFSPSLPSSIHTLLIANGNKLPLVVLSNGSVCLPGGQGRPPANKKLKVLFAGIFKRDSRDHVCVVCTCEGVTRVLLWAASSEDVRVVDDVTLDKTQLTRFSVCENKLFALDEGGGVCRWELCPAVEFSGSMSLGPQPIKLLIATTSPGYFITYDGHSLCVWEPTYMTRQGVMEADEITELHSCGAWVCDGVKVCRVESGSRGLVAALGKTQLPPTTRVLSWDEQECEDDQVLVRLTDRRKTPSLELFMSEFSSCPLTPNHCYTNLLTRLLEESKFWAREALERLMRAGAVPLSCSDPLLRGVWEHKDWELMTVCLECVGGFSESVVVEVLEQLLMNGDINSDRKDRLLYLLLCQPLNDALLQQPLSQLQHTTIRELLQFLSRQLSVKGLLAHPPLAYNSLLDWTGQIIDVHFTHLTFDPSARDTLALLQRMIKNQVTCWNRLGVVRGMRGAWSATSSAPSTNKWLYKVETLNIDW